MAGCPCVMKPKFDILLLPQQQKHPVIYQTSCIFMAPHRKKKTKQKNQILIGVHHEI